MEPRKYTFFITAYNGGGYLRECLSSVLAQTYTHFNVVVLDDGSTDDSMEWVRGLKDPRVLVVSAPHHLGIEANWARILEIPKNEYMAVPGQDDVYAPGYLAAIESLVDKFPDASLYQAHFNVVDGEGRIIRPCLPLPERETAAQYIGARLNFLQDSFTAGYVCRSRDYIKAGGIPGYPKLIYADDALWIKLARLSYMAAAKENCASCRVHSASTSGGLKGPVMLEALGKYAALLKELSASDPGIKAVVENSLPGHMLAQFHWALDPKRCDDPERAQKMVRELAEAVDRAVRPGFSEIVSARIFGPFSFLYRFFARALRWAGRGLAAGCWSLRY